jgi:hypothetical protein
MQHEVLHDDKDFHGNNEPTLEINSNIWLFLKFYIYQNVIFLF